MKNGATPQSHKVDHRELLARQGLRLPVVILKHLRSVGIYCQPSISIEHQHLAKKYVLRGVESGGAVAELGAYSSFVDEQGAALPWLQRIDTIGVNGVHAIVVAPVLVRLQMLRIERTYDLLITRHSLARSTNQQRPGSKVQFSSMDVEGAWRWSFGEKTQPSEAGSAPSSTAAAESQSPCRANFKPQRRD